MSAADAQEFENYVNYAGSKTFRPPSTHDSQFENYVNYAGSKTHAAVDVLYGCLRTM